MSSTRVLQAALFDYLEAGLPTAPAFLQALVVYRTHLAAIPGPAASRNAFLANRYIQELLNARGFSIPEQMGFVVNDHDDGIVRIPRADCMASHLPTDRTPTRDEINEAWERCGGLAPGN
jgi:hypothetical protein